MEYRSLPRCWVDFSCERALKNGKLLICQPPPHEAEAETTNQPSEPASQTPVEEDPCAKYKKEYEDANDLYNSLND